MISHNRNLDIGTNFANSFGIWTTNQQRFLMSSGGTATFFGNLIANSNVGIGGTLANKKLYVLGDTTNYQILAEQPSGYAGLSIKSTTVAQTWSFIASDNSGNSDLLLYGGAAAGTKLTISSAGLATFSNDIELSRAARTTIYASSTNQGVQLKSNGSGVLQLNADGGGDVTIAENGGNVGIGVTPSAWRDSVAVNSVIQGADNYAILNRNDGGTKTNYFIPKTKKMEATAFIQVLMHRVLHHQCNQNSPSHRGVLLLLLVHCLINL